jgi:hypothetical protein
VYANPPVTFFTGLAMLTWISSIESFTREHMRYFGRGDGARAGSFLLRLELLSGAPHRLRDRCKLAIGPRLLPEPERDWKWIDVEPPPPSGFITRKMKFAVMDSAHRHDELVAHSAAHGTRLCKGEMVRIRWHAAAHKARLPQHEFPVVLIAQTNRLAQSMDHVPGGLLLGPPRSFVAGTDIRSADGYCTLLSESVRPPGRGEKTIRCPTEGRSLRGPVRVRAIAHGGELYRAGAATVQIVRGGILLRLYIENQTTTPGFRQLRTFRRMLRTRCARSRSR